MLTYHEVQGVTGIDVGDMEIKTLRGIKYFTEIDELICYANQLTELDLTYNKKLTTLNCDNNQLTTLDLSKQPLMEQLSCSENQLTTLDLTVNRQLKTLYCGGNQLKKLTLPSPTIIQSLGVHGNQFTSLDLWPLKQLSYLECGGNPMTTIDVTPCKHLRTLYCRDGQLTSITTATDVPLNTVDIRGNRIGEWSMDNLVNNLFRYQYSDYGVITVKDFTADNDFNVITPAQVAVAKSKNWSVRAWTKDGNKDYEGTELVSLRMGDVNSDSNVDMADISTVIDIMAKGTALLSGDVNGDRTVDVADIATVIAVMAGTVTEPLAPEGAEAVDLGLPSGTKWANMNVGASVPSDNGLYFAWGETVGYKGNTSGHDFEWYSYKWLQGGYRPYADKQIPGGRREDRRMLVRQQRAVHRRRTY